VLRLSANASKRNHGHGRGLLEPAEFLKSQSSLAGPACTGFDSYCLDTEPLWGGSGTRHSSQRAREPRAAATGMTSAASVHMISKGLHQGLFCYCSICISHQLPSSSTFFKSFSSGHKSDLECGEHHALLLLPLLVCQLARFLHTCRFGKPYVSISCIWRLPCCFAGIIEQLA